MKTVTENEAARAGPLDHDHDGKKGGSAPVPEVVHLVVVKDDATRGLSHGEVIAVGDAEVKALHSAGVARNATAVEVELARPRIRGWASPAA